MKTKSFRQPGVAAAFLGAILVMGQGWLTRAGDLPVTNGLVLRLSANYGVTTAANGLVSEWADQSGTGHSASQPTASSQPMLVTNQLNGLPVVRFGAGGDHFMSLAGQVITSAWFTIITVTRDVSTGTNFRELISNWDWSSGGSSIFFGTMGQNPVRARFTDDFGGYGCGQCGVGTITNPASFFLFSGVSRSNSVALYQNTHVLASRGTPLAGRISAGNYVIGRQGSGTFDEYWRGDIAEMLVYDRDLPDEELQEVWQFLALKYLPTLVPLQLTGIIKLDDHNYRLTGTGGPGTTYGVLGNTNLATTNWLSLGAATADALGNLIFTDSQGSNYSQRFYRIGPR